MKRFFLVLTVALVMAAILVATAAPAFAVPPLGSKGFSVSECAQNCAIPFDGNRGDVVTLTAKPGV